MKKEEPKPQQGKGGKTPSTHAPYLAWIEQCERDGKAIRGYCHSEAVNMLKAFPELKLVRGYVVKRIGLLSVFPDEHVVACADPGDGHWWLETESGEIVDPTRKQFGENIPDLRYVAFDESKAGTLPTGKCPDCGGYCYNGDSFCDLDCERSYCLYMKRECGGTYVLSNGERI